MLHTEGLIHTFHEQVNKRINKGIKNGWMYGWMANRRNMLVTMKNVDYVLPNIN